MTGLVPCDAVTVESGLRRGSNFPSNIERMHLLRLQLCRASFALLIATFALLSIAWTRAAETEVRVIEDVAYKTGAQLSEYERTRCKLDLYVPAGAKEAPCIVWFHGGGLTEGDKADGPDLRVLAGEGFVVASANYRLSPKATFPAYVEDAAAAVAWVREHAAEHGGDPRKVFVSGHSAGGYLASMVGAAPKYLQAHGIKLTDLAGVIPIAGQTMTHYTIRQERGLPKTRIIADEAAPIFHASKDTARWLILYAENDMALREEENVYFAGALKAAGHRDVTIEEIAEHDHGGIGNRLSEPKSPARKAIVSFIRAGAVPASAASK